jgi:hypothetical protein
MGLHGLLRGWLYFTILIHNPQDSLDVGSASHKPAISTQNNVNRKSYRHTCLDWDSNPRAQCLIGQRQFMAESLRPHCAAHGVVLLVIELTD